jgi:hypothetical protein
VREIVYEQQQVPCQRTEYETVYEDRPVTCYRNVTEQKVRECQVQVCRAVWECGEREERYAVSRPVWESRRLLDGFVSESPLDEFVRDRAGQSLAHVFTLLSLVLPREPLQIAFRSLHSEDEHLQGTALEYLEGVAERARAAGLVPRFGRKVLEIRPPVNADKGTAVTQLLDEAGLRRALYAGDDTTDIDAFRALDGLELGIRVAVSSDEAPSELVSAADIVVDSPADLLALLARL